MSDRDTDDELRGVDSLDLSRAEIRERSLAGVFFVTASGAFNLFVGFVGNLLLARMLTPDDFGVVAIGLTATVLGNALADGGLGSGMIRRPEPPTKPELRTLNGIQLVIAVSIFLPVALIALGLGSAGAVTALMIASIPITTLQTPGRVVLARTMRFDRQAAADLTAQTSFYVAAVSSVALGAGVWGLASGTLVRAAVGTVLIAWLSIGFLLPSLRGWRALRGLVVFGLKFQANWLLLMLREQSVNLVTGIVGGFRVLGLWTLAMRLLQMPLLAFGSLYTVGFPALSNLLARGEDPRPVILRMVRRASIGATLIFPAWAAMSPEFIPAVFGEPWRESAEVMPFICLSSLILGSIAVGASSYLNAAGKPGVVAMATAAFGVVWVALTAGLLPLMGIAAIGVGNLCGALLEASILDRATLRHAGIAPHRPMLLPLAAALPAGTIGWLVCVTAPPGLITALAAGALTVGLCVVGLLVVCRSDFRDTMRLGTGMLTTAVGKFRRSSPST
jgi:O-antigen/teichoic acid export membrane protein